MSTAHTGDFRAPSGPARESPVGAPPPGSWRDSAAVLVLGALLLLPGLGAYPFWDPDEGRVAQVAREMAARDTWLVPELHGAPYYDKPAPFYLLLRALDAHVDGPERAGRLPSALATLATALVLQRFARPRIGRAPALLGAVVYLTCPAVIALGRFCNFDATLTACLTVAVTAWLRWLDEPVRPPWLAYAAMGTGALVKGPIGIVLPLLVAGACAIGRRNLRVAVRRAGLVRGFALIGAIFLPWLLAAALSDPAYVRSFLLEHNVERYVSERFHPGRSLLYYPPVLAGLLLPWSLVVPALLVRRTTSPGPTGPGPPDSEAILRRSVCLRDLAIWTATVVAFFSLAGTKLGTYVLPAVPPAALWVGAGLAGFVTHSRSRSGPGDPGSADAHRDRATHDPAGAIWMRVSLAVWATALAGLPVVGWIYLRANFPDLQVAAAGGVPLALLAVFATRRAWRRPAGWAGLPLVFATTSGAAVLLAYLFAAPILSTAGSDAALARVAGGLAPGTPLVGFRIEPTSLAFYADAPVTRALRIEDLDAVAARGPWLVVTRRRHLPTLAAAGYSLHPWYDNGRHVLYGPGPRPVPIR